MTKEELLALGLNEDQIKEVFKINGIDVEKAKGEFDTVKNTLATKETELTTAKDQLKTANETIQSYKDMNIEDIKKSADDYKKKFEDAETKAQAEIDALKFEHAVENALNKAGAKNVKSVKALLDLEVLKGSKNVDTDLEAQLTALKESDAYLFKEDESSGGANPKITDKGKKLPGELNNPWSKEYFNLTEQGRLLKEDPERAKLLMTQV